ncbi:hypothetical protein L6452_43932 [Arctium lappa]|uniref:Uncharacterized protein n=1 Tax=Arctium lappa TaxID=4217 RepID=A0ACB8XE88_ARCLA|nr:hypothetical protein L6452_43932 [Arctium lappa]
MGSWRVGVQAAARSILRCKPRKDPQKVSIVCMSWLSLGPNVRAGLVCVGTGKLTFQKCLAIASDATLTYFLS